MKILIGFESSGVVREAFRSMGHEAWSCDLQPADDGSEYHYQMDIFLLLADRRDEFDLFIMHPTCTYLCSSGLHWNRRQPERRLKTADAIEDFLKLVEILKDYPFAIENPIGCMSTYYRKPDQIIQPWQFGHDASKATCLWLNKLPVLKHTELVEPRLVDGKKRWSNQTDSGQNKLAPSKDRWKIRSRTYEGIADAMAVQWNEDTINRQPELI